MAVKGLNKPTTTCMNIFQFSARTLILLNNPLTGEFCDVTWWTTSLRARGTNESEVFILANVPEGTEGHYGVGDLYNHVSCLYPWRELPQVSFLSRQTRAKSSSFKVLSRQTRAKSSSFKVLSRQTRAFRDKTRLLSRRKCACRDKSFVGEKIRFVATKYFYRDFFFSQDKYWSRQNYFCRDKHTTSFVPTKVCLSRQNFVSTNTCLLQQIFVATRTCLPRQIFVATKVLSTFVATNDVFCREKQYLTRQTRFCRQNICRDKNYTCGTLASDIPQGVMSIEARTVHSQRPQRSSCCELTHFFLHNFEWKVFQVLALWNVMELESDKLDV